jgi:hypothetical protein
MIMKLYFFTIMAWVISIPTFPQESGFEYFVVLNANLYLPGSPGNKGVYPILWYDQTTKPKVLIGGFGAGFSVFRSLTENLGLKAQANLSRHTYWDEPIELRGDQNEPLGEFTFGSSDYAIGLTSTLHYYFSKKLSIGTGLGAQLFTLTLSRTPKFEGFELTRGDITMNHYYKTFLPVLPVELSLKAKRLLFNIRYEHGLSNRYKHDLARYNKDTFSLLYFELGFRIGSNTD